MPRWSRFVAPAALLLAAALLVVQWALRPAPDPAIGRAFPRLALAPLAGTPPLHDGDLRAGGPVLVNLFASWCVPCRAEAPQLVALRRRGIAVVGIAVRDAPGDAARFVADNGAPFARLGLDPKGRVQAALGSAGLPETWLVDGGGIVRARYRGDLHAADVPAVAAAVAAAR